MRLKNKVIFLVLLFSITNVFSDVLKRTDSSRLVGTILSSSADSIKFLLEDSSIVTLPKNSMSTITFSTSDELLIYPHNFIRCKIIQEIPPYIIYVNSKGLYRVHQSQVISIAFNSSGKLKVKQLPETGAVFKSSVFIRKVTPLHDVLFIGFLANVFYDQAKDWKKEFYYNKSDFLLFGGGVLGYKFKNNLTPLVGFEMSFRDLESKFAYESRFHMNHLFVGLEYPCSFGLDTKLKLVPTLHAGACSIKGTAFTYSFREYQLNEVKPSIRMHLGVAVPVTQFITWNLGAAYLFIPEVKLALPADFPMKSLSLNFSGISFLSRIDFYLHNLNVISK